MQVVGSTGCTIFKLLWNFLWNISTPVRWKWHCLQFSIHFDICQAHPVGSELLLVEPLYPFHSFHAGVSRYNSNYMWKILRIIQIANTVFVINTMVIYTYYHCVDGHVFKSLKSTKRFKLFQYWNAIGDD